MERKRKCVRNLKDYYENVDDLYAELDNTDSDPDFSPNDEENGVSGFKVEDLQAPSPQHIANVSSRSPILTPVKSPRKRKRKTHMKQVDLRKKRRNEGRAYQTKSGKNIPGRTLGEMCKCPLKCHEKVTEDQKLVLFNAFWDMGNFNMQNAYLFGCIEKIPIKRRYCQNPEASYKQNTFIFKIKLQSGSSLRVCKKSFMSIHGLQNARGRINNIIKKIVSEKSTPSSDKRGTHDTRPHKVSAEAENSVHEHIKAIPKYQSHYSRAQNPNKVYLGCDITIRSLYNEYYLNFCEVNNLPKVSEDKYRRIFCEKYNIGFKLPKSDTCSKCDSLQIIIDDANASAEQKQTAKLEKEIHLRRADSAREKLKNYTAMSKETPNDVHVITVDLQQTLPTPKLSCGPAFYCRKMWTYNVGIHNCSSGQGFMFMWDETVGKRGSDEIGSCIIKYLSVANIHAKKLVIFTDNCGGQNKNWNIMSLWSHLVRSKRFESIEHYFLITGHTFLPSDRDFAIIEKYHTKHCQNVYNPEQWREIVAKCGTRNKFIVTCLMSEDIFDLTKLQENLFNTKHKFCTDGVTLPRFSKAICFKFDSSKPSEMKLKHKMNEDFLVLNLKKRGRTSASILHMKRNAPNIINKKKLDDVKSLLPYIPPIYHGYYNSLQSAGEDQEEDIMIE
ncbi:uncharacterized protein LOC111052342 isoform X2 [Nilaparvata lugens]|uniref:uncharacterized protein LOC111052342 isoform X2 n=1 Tax=Nilaparvata lugens TaxID=108931 RepID=UPI00193E2C2D|nr:uncharacterized protein LOC111052342 isoform X2 [Nilaparvata lugens]